MVRLDDDELNINPEVAAALRYPRQGNARGLRNARAEAQPRHAHDQGNGFPAGLFGAFGVALLLLLIICAVFGITGYVSQAGSTVKADSRPQTSAQSREWQSAAEEHPAEQPQAPPAIETTNPEIDSEQTMQPPPEPESVPNGVEVASSSDPSSAEPEKPEITVAETIQKEPVVISQPSESEQQEKKVELLKTKRYGERGASAPPFSNWRWVCVSRNGLRCALRDVNGKYVQNFFWNGGSVQASAISTAALFPRALVWRCTKMPGILYCSILDGRGTNRQGCSYDGRSLMCAH
jgi:hypothetical protein